MSVLEFFAAGMFNYFMMLQQALKATMLVYHTKSDNRKDCC